jgi:enoyl-CoA hydratase
MAADVRLMSGGTIGITEIAVGVPFPISAIEICRHVMGTSAGLAALGGQPVTAEEAARLGWVDELANSGDLIEAAVGRARTLGRLSAAVYALTKQQVHRPARAAITNNTAADAQVVENWRSTETRARIAEFVAARLTR